MRRVVLLCWLMFLPMLAFGESRMETFVREITYRASDDDSRNSARTKAEAQLRQALLREIGSFVETNYRAVTTIDNFNLKLNYEEAVTITTRGNVQMRIVDERWDGREYWMRAEMTVDVGAINARLRRQQEEIETEERNRRAAAAETERIRQAEIAAADRARRQREQAIANLQMQIDAAQRQVSSLEAREADTRARRDASRAEFGRARDELAAADKEYKDALAFSSSNPTNQAARRTVGIASENLDAAKTKHNALESQAKIAHDLWVVAESDLRKERAHLESLRTQLRQVDSGEISAAAVLDGTAAIAVAAQNQTPANQPAQTPAPTTRSRANDAFANIDEMMGVSPRQRPASSAQTAQPPKAEVKKETKEPSGRQFVFSVRPSVHLGNRAGAVGGDLEFGSIIKNGIYWSITAGGGVFYYGVGANFGYCFNRNGLVKNVLGITAGYWETMVLYVDEWNNRLDNDLRDVDMGFGGVFWKMMIGRTGNFDITNRLLFGVGERRYYDDNYGYFLNEEIYGMSMIYSVGIGYTLTRSKGKR